MALQRWPAADGARRGRLLLIHGLSSSINVNGVHFSNFTVQGKAITSQTDSDASWNINSFVSNITFAP